MRHPGSALPLELEAEVNVLLTITHHELRSRLLAFAARAATGRRSAAAQEAPLPQATVRQCSSDNAELAREGCSPQADIPMPGQCCEETGMHTLKASTVDDLWSRPAPKPDDCLSDDDASIRGVSIKSSPSAIEMAALTVHLGGKAQIRASMALSDRARSGRDRRSKLLRLILSSRYEMAISFAILANALLIAWETQYTAEQVPTVAHEVHFDAFMLLFCVVFSMDLVLRVSAQGSLFFHTTEWTWNWFDVVVVLGSNVEAIVFLTDSKDDWLSKSSLLRVLRLVRVVRFVRALRSLLFFRSLRITVSVLCGSLLPMMPFVVIMTLVFMSFGILFTDGASDYMVAHGVDPELQKYYGSLFVTMSTLFKAISGGIDWEVAVEPLAGLSALYSVIFYGYMSFSVFALLNVVNAMFIDTTLQRSRQDRDFVVQTEQDGKMKFTDMLERLFTELDADSTGKIKLPELYERLKDPKIIAYFRAIDLRVYKVKRLFQLMDSDKSGSIDFAEFKKGCDRLRGAASQLDQAILHYQMIALWKEVKTVKELLAGDRTVERGISFTGHGRVTPE